MLTITSFNNTSKPFTGRHCLQAAVCCTALMLVLAGGCSSRDDAASVSVTPAETLTSSLTEARPEAAAPSVVHSKSDAPAKAAYASEDKHSDSSSGVSVSSAVGASSEPSRTPASSPPALTKENRVMKDAYMKEERATEADAVSISVVRPIAKRMPVQQVAPGGILTAGDIDDLRNFDFFRGYLQRAQLQCPEVQNQAIWPSVPLDNRIALKVVDGSGQPVANAGIRINRGAFSQHNAVTTTSEGLASLFPSLDGFDASERFALTVTAPDGKAQTVNIALQPDEQTGVTLEIRLNHYTAHTAQAMDVMFVIDATGSMGDEIAYLQTEFDGVVSRLSRDNPQVSLRYGLVMYRDIGDEYVVRDYGFTTSTQVMRDQLRKQSANGGGDYPEAMEQAISKGVKANWRSGNTAKVMFLVADAPPHDENLSRAFASFKQAREAGVRIYPLGASGVADTAEYLMRTGAVITQGRYLFLTDDSGVGNSHAEPKVPCYVVTPLNGLIERVLATELRSERVEADASSVIREVGHYVRGECENPAR